MPYSAVNCNGTCKMPQLYHLFNGHGLDYDLLGECHSPRQYACMKDFAFEVVFGLNKTLSTLCQPDCQRIGFDVRKRHHRIFETEHMFINYHYATTNVVKYDEYRLFDGNAILAAVGGSLGLFLGFSFLDCGLYIVNTIFKLCVIE